jgi:plasmid stabilization system protein ParE
VEKARDIGQPLRSQIACFAYARRARSVVRSFPALAAMLGNHLTEHRNDLTSRPLRFWLVRDYLIAYAPDEKRLWVVAVLHGSRNPRVMAAILRGRE